ncbi:MAG: flagellar basal body P-ring formation protein FlgA [Nitrospinae bacterium]|nr:flagellar basal body P-ring formation protein FlgA [Nitrospinota bacterium]
MKPNRRRTLLLAAASLLLATAALANPVPDAAHDRFADRLTEAVTDTLNRELAGPGRRVGAVSVPLPANVRPPAGYDTMELTLPYKERLSDRIFVTVTFLKEGQPLGRLNVMATAELWAKVAVTTREITRGAHLSGEDVALSEVRLDPSHNGVVTDLKEAVGKTAERSLAAGTPLRAAYLSNPTLVNSGDMVTVEADNGRIRITSQGVAKEDGDRGQWIRILNVQSNKLFTARVVGPGTVRVEF